jgi:hypothetical protein
MPPRTTHGRNDFSGGGYLADRRRRMTMLDQLADLPAHCVYVQVCRYLLCRGEVRHWLCRPVSLLCEWHCF